MNDLVLRSELSRARAHLLRCQNQLAWDRKYMSENDPLRSQREASFLAALSWMWEEQVKVCGCGHCEGQCCDYVAEPQ